ncbi:MAG TPA: response regulator [Steroidobacteraceae bacterium]|jgi:hypothetical protein|nr:response regulator [Steroidobacteraceae bacterium]
MSNGTELLKKSGKIKILVVDDTPAALYTTGRILRAANYEVLEATTGATALAIADQADMVVLDVNLPDMDGFEVCRILRARADTARIPVLHLSATFTHSGDFVEGFEAGADTYLTRPVEPAVLLTTVRTLLFARHADTIRRGLDAKLQTMFAVAPVAIAILDSSFKYENVNPAYCELTGYTADELTGMPGDLCVTGPRPFPARQIIESIAGHYTTRLQVKKKDGSLAEVEWHLVKEEISGVFILTAIDITEQQNAERARENLLISERAARGEAERSTRLKAEFLAIVSHELRNPLNAILGWANVLTRQPQLTDTITQGLQAIERNSRIQAQMISDLLDHASIAFGKIRLTPEAVDPYKAVRAALETSSSAAQVAGVRLNASFSGWGLTVDADPDRLQQIVLNLLSNALKFSNAGDSVDVVADQVDNSFRLTVTDHGRGIEASFLPKIFEHFSQQENSTTRSRGGLGLGLAIVKQLVDLHGGSIEASSEGIGMGATFTLMLPLSRNESRTGITDSQPLRTLDLSSFVILVVDDDADSRSLTTRILKEVGASVLNADSAEAAITSINANKPNLLISDIGMPEQDGYTMLRRLRSMGYTAEQLPAIALTAFARMEDRAQALTAGFQDHLIKPLDPQALLRRVATLCRTIQ